MKKYNRQTGCYKIDIFVNEAYYCSTDQSKTCKAAKVRFLELHPKLINEKITANFYKD